MGAKIILTGHAREFHQQERSVSFYIVTGPAVRHPPRGLKLFGQTRYQIECTLRQWRRARYGPDDDSDLIVKGYLEPRRDPDTGQLYVAVVADSVESTLCQCARELEQLREALTQARDAFMRAKGAGIPRETLEEKAAAFVKANASLQSHLAQHPELDARRS